MLVDHDEIGPIVRGKLREIRTPYKPPKIGTIQGVQGRVGKPARCHVLIEDVRPHPDGGHTVRFRLHHRQLPPRLLRPGYGYTTEPAHAMRGEADPGEAPDREALEQLAADSRRKVREERERRRKTQQLLKVEQRIAEYTREAKRRRIDIRNELRLIQQLKARGKSPEKAALGIRMKLDRDDTRR